MAGLTLPVTTVRAQIASAIHVVMQLTRLSDGRRRVTNVSEVVGMEGDVITMQDIFVFERTGINTEGRVQGRFRATGVRPKFSEKLKASGIEFPANLFQRVIEVH